MTERSEGTNSADRRSVRSTEGLGIWIDPTDKMPGREKPVIVVATVGQGRKRQVMVAWRKSEWRIREEKDEAVRRKAKYGWLFKVYEWEGINGEHPTPTKIAAVHAWQRLPKMPNVK